MGKPEGGALIWLAPLDPRIPALPRSAGLQKCCPSGSGVGLVVLDRGYGAALGNRLERITAAPVAIKNRPAVKGQRYILEGGVGEASPLASFKNRAWPLVNWSSDEGVAGMCRKDIGSIRPTSPLGSKPVQT